MAIQLTETVSRAARRDILDLEQKISSFSQGDLAEEAFRKFRLTRGVYGQRQPGVQMIRIKLPHGRITADQLVRIADLSDTFATGNLHATTRQDIQFHYVKLADSPAALGRPGRCRHHAERSLWEHRPERDGFGPGGYRPGGTV